MMQRLYEILNDGMEFYRSRRNNETDDSRLLRVCMQLSEDQVFSAASGSSEHINIHCDGRNLMGSSSSIVPSVQT